MRHNWTQEEEDFISSLIGYQPVREIVLLVKKNLNTGVSDLAIKAKVEKVARALNKKIADRVDNYSMSALAKALGINNIIVYRWLKSGLKDRKTGGLHLIKHRDVIAFAKANPQKFRQVKRDNLTWLFTYDKEWDYWVDLIVNSKAIKPLRSVLCVTTGKVYPSLRSVEMDLGLSRDRIKTYIKSELPTKVGDRYLSFRWSN